MTWLQKMELPPMNRCSSCSLLLLAALAATPAALHAQTPSPLAEWQFSGGVPLRSYFLDTVPKWEYELGLAFAVQPKYDGARAYEVQPGPTIDVRYRDRFFASTGEGLGWNVLHGKTYRAGVALTYDFGRRLNREQKSRGLGDDVQGAPELKLFAEYVIFPVVLRGDVRQALGGYDGIVGDISVYLPVTGSTHYFVLVGPSVTYGNEPFMRQFFGVSAEQAAATGTQAYNAESGIKSYSLGSNATWLINDHWRLNGTVAITRLIGDAANSPTTARKTQYGFALSLDYNWNTP